MAAVKTATDPKRGADFLDSMEEEMRRVSEHLERRERRLGLRKGRRGGGEIVNGYSFSEGSGAEAGARRRRINHYPRRQLRPSEDDGSSTGSADSLSPCPRSAPPAHSPLPSLGLSGEQLHTARTDSSSTSEAASPAARRTLERWGSRESQQDDPELMMLKEAERDVTANPNWSRRAVSSSPLHTLKSPPPPVAPKPRRSPGLPSPRNSSSAKTFRPRAASAPLSKPPRETERETQSVKEVTPNKGEEEQQISNSDHNCSQAEESHVVEEVATLEEMADNTQLKSSPTPIPNELSEQVPSPSLTPEPSEPLVIHQVHREKSSTPDSRCSTLSAASPVTSSVEVMETPSKEAASPGIIEISGNFSFPKRRTPDRRSVSPIAEEADVRESETGLASVDEVSEKLDVTQEDTEVPSVENALLEAMIEGGREEEGEKERGGEEGEEERGGEEGEEERVGKGGEEERVGEEGEEERGCERGEAGERSTVTEIETETECGFEDEPRQEDEQEEVGEQSLVKRLTDQAEALETSVTDTPLHCPTGNTALHVPPVTRQAVGLTSDPQGLDSGMGDKLSSDHQGPEIKSLPSMSPALGRQAGANLGQRHRKRNEEMALMMRDLQLQLREKEEELGRQRRAAERDAREREEQVSKLTKEGQKLEREKWELLKRARDGAERSLSLRTQLDLKENQLRSLQADLLRTRDEMMSVKSANTSLRALLSELRTPKPSKSVGVQAELGGGTLRRNHSMELALQGLAQPASGILERGIDFRASTTHLDRGAYHRISNCSTMSEGWPEGRVAWDQQRDSGRWEREQSVASVSSSLYEPASREGTPTHSPQHVKKHKKKRTPFFGKLRKSEGKRGSTPTIIDGVDLSQSSLIHGHSQTPISFPYQARVSADTQEHWRVMEEAQHVPFKHWNGRAIVAWVTTGLGMNQYTAAIREHVTTGNAMLALSDSDMDKKLGVTTSLHRRKLRLAIEEQRRPDRVQYPLAGKIDCGWLAEVWVADIGLPYLSDVMAAHLVDGRVLESLTKDDLKKYFKMTKKLEQMSFLSGVELLRMHDFNREAILEHRTSQHNPLYWTNRDVGDWLRDIRLGDYATNLLGSGVHGALLFLERSKFSADHLAQVLQLPGGRSPARRHLSQQLARLFREEASESPFRAHRIPPTSLSGVSPVPSTSSFSGSLYRTGSSPSLNQSASQMERMSMEDRIRHSLRESALRSVTMSPSTHSPGSPSLSPSSPVHPPSPVPTPSPLTHTTASGTSPLTHTTASGTTV